MEGGQDKNGQIIINIDASLSTLQISDSVGWAIIFSFN